MAELLGTVVGVVSLGLQVCSGITKYLDGIKGHKDEIASASRLCQALQGAVDQIQAMRNDIATASRGHDTAIEQAMMSANAELAVLRAFIDEVRVDDDPSTSISGWIKDRTNRVTYPFRRSHLDRLESQLSEANKALQSALQVAQLAISIETGNITRSIGAEVSTTRTELNTKLDDLQQVSNEDHHTMGKLSDDLSHVSLSLETFVPQAQRHMEVSSVQFTRMESRMEEFFATLVSTDSQVVLRRVLTKPDALRLACTEFEIGHRYPHSTIEPQSDWQHGVAKNSMFSCRCHPRRVRRQMIRGFRSAFVTAERLEEGTHAPDCPLAGISPSRKSWSLGVSTRVFQMLLSTAITVSTSSTFGAGGLSICPSFRMYFVRDQSPAAAIIRTIQDSTTKLGEESFPFILRKGIRALHWIFKTGKASPLDVDACDNNLLNIACCGDYAADAFGMWKLKPLLEFLVALGVPRDHYDIEEGLPFHSLFGWFAFQLGHAGLNGSDASSIKDMNFTALAQDHQFLMPDDISVISDYGFRDGGVADVVNIKFYHEVARALPEMTECMPLRALIFMESNLTIFTGYGNAIHMAIIQKDEVALAELLKKGTEKATLWEADTFGYAPVELLASWTRGLELLFFHCGTQVLQSDDRRVTSVLSFALSGSKERCSVSPPARCPHTCSCADNVVMLLEADCLITLDERLLTFVLNASTRCQEAVVSSLKTRREELACLALNRLSPAEINTFGVSGETILDIKTQEVVEALERRNVQVPQRLQTQVLGMIRSRGQRYSLYHLISASGSDTDTKYLLNMVRSHGFRDIDAANSIGMMPSMVITKSLTFMNLVRMGADPTLQVPGSVTGFTTTHLLFGGFYCYRMNRMEKEDIRMTIEANEQIWLSHSFPPVDECACECAPYGCHPYSMLCKRIVAYLPSQWRPRLDQLSNRMMQVPDGDWDVPEDFKLVATRMATFESLSIHHTCCLSDGKPRHIDDEDIQEFLEEDLRAIEILHELLPEFEAKLVEMSCSFSEFLRTYWKDRMVQVLEELNEPQPLTEDNLRGIRRLGIDLQVGDGDGDGDKACDKVKPKRGSLEYFMAELDEIMEKAGV